MSEKFNEHVQSEEPGVNSMEGVNNIFPNEDTSTQESDKNIQEEVVTPLEGQEFLEEGEAYETAEALANHINETDGTTYTAEDLMNDPESATWINQFIEKHPTARKALRIFALSTALAGAAAPQEAKADIVGDIVSTVAHGLLQQQQSISRQQMHAYHQQDQRYIQLEQQRLNVPNQKQRIYDTYEQRRADLRHQAEMRQITDPNARAEAELNYQEQRALQNVDIQERQREQAMMNREQIAQMRDAARMKHTIEGITVNTANRVIQHGANDFLRSILTGRR